MRMALGPGNKNALFTGPWREATIGIEPMYTALQAVA